MPRIRKPEWLRIGRMDRDKIREVQQILRKLNLHTVCEESMCPNIGKCFEKKTATFLVMGEICTRNCRFCDIKFGKPLPLDSQEPDHIVEAAKKLGLRHVVITSVTRDDLSDCGAAHFAEITEKLRDYDENLIIELLIPDLKGKEEHIRTIVKSRPDIINHNIEVIPRLFRKVTPQANYEKSLKLLEVVKEMDPEIHTKSGLMVGLGETKEEVFELLKDLKETECDILTIGQYLKPPSSDLEIEEYVHPDVFKEYETKAYEMGFKFVASAPFVRSSFNAEEADFLLVG
ncbi:MAG: lipoyl synthase [Candidatus Heimdallarchaeota archaeon]|nr:lipoyl synthase [Candidatus Heimdallarchaeota archaeon]MCK4877817.1 lipoyl synthase [Candidatus Heimdallarchaeota archaeon]